MDSDLPDVEEYLRRQPAWQPPSAYGHRLAARIPAYGPVEQSRVRLPQVPASAYVGVAAAVLGAIGEGNVDLVSVPAFMAATLMISIGSWLIPHTLSGMKSGPVRSRLPSLTR